MNCPPRLWPKQLLFSPEITEKLLLLNGAFVTCYNLFLGIRIGKLSSKTEAQRSDPEMLRKIDYDSLSEIYQSKKWLEAIGTIAKLRFEIENAFRDLLGSDQPHGA